MCKCIQHPISVIPKPNTALQLYSCINAKAYSYTSSSTSSPDEASTWVAARYDVGVILEPGRQTYAQGCDDIRFTITCDDGCRLASDHSHRAHEDVTGADRVRLHAPFKGLKEA